MKVDTGMQQEQRKTIAKGLSRLLADSYTLYIKTHNYHWNVTGSMFVALHNLFEEQYIELATAVDDIAERIRALGEFAPGSYKAFSELTKIEEEEGHPNAKTMIKNLVKGHETIVLTAKDGLPAANDAGDEGSVDLLTQRITAHEKTAWMLRSLLED